MAIPYSWKQLVRREDFVQQAVIPNQPMFLINNRPRSVDTMTCKDFYRAFMDSKETVTPTAVNTWSNEFTVNADDWKHIYKLSFSITLETKLQAFQYSLLHRFVVHKKLLFLQKLVEEGTCDHCDQIIDTITHRFWGCPPTQRFWTQVKHWWNSFNEDVALTPETVIFGFYANSDQYTLNNILLTGKYFIHKMKLNGKIPLFSSFQRFLKDKIMIEKHILFQNDKMIH
jgi:hypothetical protein